MTVMRDRGSHFQIKASLWQKITLVVFGIFLTIVLLEIGLRLGGFILLSMQEYRNILSLKQKGEYRILCLGESTTQNQYPAFLDEILNHNNIGVKFSVIDKGRGGIWTPVILTELDSDLNKYYPDLVVAMIGINDGGTHIPYEAVSHSKTILFIRSLRTYKLARLLRLHFIATVKERRITNMRSSAESVLQSLPAEQGSYWERESTRESLKKAIALNPANDQAYAELGIVYLTQDNRSYGEDSFRKAIALNPANAQAYYELGDFHLKENNLLLAENFFQKAIALNPKLDEACYLQLIEVNLRQNKFSQAEEVGRRALENQTDPGNDKLLGEFASLYSAEGRYKLAQDYFKKANEIRLRYYLPSTVDNYKRIKEILDKRGIRLACIQYPMRSIEPLKKIFEGQANIIFVDNEKIFKEAVNKEGYRAYFGDTFGGDFGHATPKGNRILAENIANVILREVFHK